MYRENCFIAWQGQGNSSRSGRSGRLEFRKGAQGEEVLQAEVLGASSKREHEMSER